MKFPKKVAVAFLMALALCAVGFCKSAHAEGAVDQPLLSWERVSFAAGVNHAWYAAPLDGSAAPPPASHEWEAGIFGAYNITPLLSLTASSLYGFDNKAVQTRVGVRIRLGKGE